MKITLLAVGKTVEPHFVKGIEEYLKRTQRYLTVDMQVVPELKNTKNITTDQQKEKEAELILKEIQASDHVVLLDEKGKQFTSLGFADWMQNKMINVNKRLLFIIGGPYGFSQQVYNLAQEKIALSKMTFSHQMIRLIFVEQIYRAVSILHGSPYHHE